MNTFFSIDAATAWHVIGFVVDLGIKATVALLAALAITWGVRRRSAALRHRVWFLTYCGLLLLPVLPLAVPKWQIPLPAAFHRFQPDVSPVVSTAPQITPPTAPANQNDPHSQPDPDSAASSRTDDPSWSADATALRAAERGRPLEATSASSPSLTPSPAVTTPMLAVAAPPPPPPTSSVSFFVVAVTAVWAGGVAVSLFGVWAGRRRGRRLLRSAEPVRDARWLELLEQLQTNLRLLSRVRLLESPQAVVPMATGVVHLAVLLPRETGEWPTTLRRHVLIHELAHVKRRDVLQHLICRLAAALYWFHPLAWYGARRMRLEREIACDDFVLMAGEHPCDYAAELVGIARQLHGIAMPWAVCMANVSTLEERVRAMLDRARSHGPLSVGAARSLLIVALAAIGLLAAVEPGTSSVRKPEPASAGIIQEPARAGQSPANEHPPIVDRTVGNMIVAQANDKSPVVSVSTAPDQKDPTYSFAGTVFDQQGQPIPDARISLSYFQAKPPAFELPAAVSDVHGRFEFTRKKSEIADPSNERYLADICVIAEKAGFGFASVPATACETTTRLADTIHELKLPSRRPPADKASNVLTLVPDDVPIRGRLLTIDGRAVAGAKITVVGVWTGKNGSLDAFEGKLKEGAGWQHISALYWGYPQAGVLMYRATKRWYPLVLTERRRSIVLPVASNSDGRFTLTGLGRERMAEILITAPGLETTLKFVRTRRGAVLPIGGPNDGIPEEIEPSDFSLVLGPSVPIVGRVVDARTRQPLAGIRVQPTSNVFAHAVTDAQGRYRMEALPLGDNNLEINPPKGSRYLPGGVTVNTTAGAARVVRNMALTAGTLVHGQVIDERTHRPAQGTVQYFAFESNPLLKNTDSLREFVTWNKVFTDAEGRFEIAALAGPGILGFEGTRVKGAPGFPRGVGADRIQGPMRRPEYQEFPTVPENCRVNEFNLLVPLNPRPDEREIALDLKLRSGSDVPVRLVAFDGRPLSAECMVVRNGGMWRRNEGVRFTVEGYFPTETLKLEVFHSAQNLVGTSELTGSPPATLTITLYPGASFAGRVLDAEGLPVPYATVNSDGGRQDTADAQGRFEIKGLIPGSKYTGWVSLTKRVGNWPRREMFDLFTDVTAQKGETKQLGDLRLKPRRVRSAKKRSSAAKRPKTATTKTSQPAPRDPKQAEPATENEPLRLAARVLDPNGKPVAGARVAIHAILGDDLSGTGVESVPLAAVSTDSLGRFEYSVDRSSMPAYKGAWPKYSMIGYVATMPGFGLAVGSYSDRSKEPPADLKLVPDEPVRGRVLNLEGRPVSGARIDVIALFKNTEYLGQLKQMQAASLREPVRVPEPLHAPLSPAMLPTATTDTAGHFEIRGLGRDRLADLRIVGPQIAVSILQVVTRPMPRTQFRLRSPGGGPMGDAPYVFYGSQFDFAAEPSVPVEGTVTDEESGSPIAGVIVASDRLPMPVPVPREGLISTVSDARGRFNLEGLPVSDENTLKILPRYLPYLSAGDLRVPRGKPSQATLRDIKLRRCIWAVGRVQDVKTGKPVQGRVFFTPFHSNELAKRYSRYQSGVRSLLGNEPGARTDEEGRFRIRVIPGRGVVCFKSDQGHYIGGRGAERIPELAKDKSRQTGEGPMFEDFVPAWFSAVQEIHPAADAKTVEVNLSVDPGQHVALRLVDRSGKLLSGPLRTGGMRETTPIGGNESDKAVVLSLAPGETRIVWIQHKATGLSTYVHFTAKPGDSERTMTLEPPAVLTGRFVSTEGKPLANWSVDCDYYLGYNSMSEFPPAQTDSAGRFRFEIPAGGPFDVVSRSGPFLDIARNLSVQSGEQIDFGELVVNDRENFVDFKKIMSPKRTMSPAADPQMGNRPRP